MSILNLGALTATLDGFLAYLIGKAEDELGPKKGEEKKKWVLDRLREGLAATGLWKPLQDFLLGIAPFLLELVFKKIREELHKAGK